MAMGLDPAIPHLPWGRRFLEVFRCPPENVPLRAIKKSQMYDLRLQTGPLCHIRVQEYQYTLVTWLCERRAPCNIPNA